MITLASGTTIAQILAIFCTPITYRIYDKDDYGMLAQYLAITMVIGVFSSLQYNQAILIEKDDDKAKQILSFNQLLNICTSLLTAILIAFFGDFITYLLKNPDIKIWLYLIPISIFFKGQNELLKVWANRKKKYKIISFNSILLASLVPLVSISVGWFTNGMVFGLFLGFLSGQIVPPIVMAIRLNKAEKLFVIPDWISIRRISKKHINLPLYSLPAEFINIFSGQLPVFMLSAFAGTSVVGLYNLSSRILGLPIQVIGGAVGNVFRQKASISYHNEGNCSYIFLKTLKLLIILAVLPYGMVLFFGENIFAFVFGAEWREAGKFAQILIILYFLNFITGPLSYMYFISDKLKEDFLIRIPMILSMTIGLYFGLQYSIMAGLLIFSILRGAFYLIFLYRSYVFSKQKSI